MLRRHGWRVSPSIMSRNINCNAESVQCVDKGAGQLSGCISSPARTYITRLVVSPLTVVSFPACIQEPRKNSRSKKDFYVFSTTLHCARCQPGSFFKRCGVTVAWERMFISDATRKIVLKQATERALFPGVTFGIGWSYFWKYVWPQNTFPFIISFLKKKVPFHVFVWNSKRWD